MNKPINYLFSPSECPSDKELLDYVKGRVDSLRIHSIEAHLANCEMCSDYVEGLSLLSNPDNISEIVSEINSKVDLAASKKHKTFFLRPRIIMSVAAVIVALIAVTFVLQHQLRKETVHEKTAQQKFAEETQETATTPLEEQTIQTKQEKISGEIKPQPLSVDLDIIVVQTKASDSPLMLAENEESESFSNIVTIEDAINDNTLAEVTVDSKIGRDKETEQPRKNEDRDQTVTTGTHAPTTTTVALEKDELASQDYRSMKNVAKSDTRTETQASKPTGGQQDQGALLYENEQYQLSLDYFETILKNNPEDQRAQWYYALNLIELKRIQESKALLQAIILRNGDYKKQAEKELKKL